MPAPFKLGSSVNYWQWAGGREHGLYRVARDQVQPCDIVVLGKNGDPDQGNGPDGHTGVVAIVHRDSHGRIVGLTCIESRGHVGVCLKYRPFGDWDGAIRVVGMPANALPTMLAWERMWDAVTGTVHRVGYWSGNGRAVLGGPGWGDLNGIDCSGCDKLVIDYAFDHPGPDNPVPDDTPSVILLWQLLEENDDMELIASLPKWDGDGCDHYTWVEKSGELGHRWENAARWDKESISDHLHTGKLLFPQKPKMYVGEDGSLVVVALGDDGVANWFVCPKGGKLTQQVVDV